MQRRIRIIMDDRHEIKPDAKTNWVGDADDSAFSVKKAIQAKRETLVLWVWEKEE